ncbi:MAG: CotH kinase family protein [Ruminococcus sp.]|nr:CotH kinase family protein [Ruminococcus sp.]
MEEVEIGTLTATGNSSWGKHEIGTFDFTNYTNVRFEMISTNGNEFNKFMVNSSEKYFGNMKSTSGKLDGTENPYPNVAGQSNVKFYYEGNADVKVTFYGTRVGGADPEPTKYTVAATAGNGGTATVDKSKAEAGETATFTATPNSGYHFVNWTDNNNENAVVSTDASYIATINADTSLKANFEADAPTTYTVTATYGEGGTASVDKSEVTAGGTAIFTATPDNGYRFVNWTDNNNSNAVVSTNASYTATINANTSLKANFEANAPTPSVSWPQEIFAVADNGTSTTNLNSELVYFGGVTSGNFKVDTSKTPSFLNNNGSSVPSGSRVALPFIIDDTSADVTYTIKLYAKAKENAYACLWWYNGSEYLEDLYESNTNPVLHTSGEPEWDRMFDDPATFVMTGDKFKHGTGTYYAGVGVFGGNNWINLWKIEVTKTGGKEPALDEYAEVLPHKNAGSVAKSGNTLTASTNSARDWEFVGWYSDKDCKNLITNDASTEVSEGKKLYAKFDYVAYDMPIFDITTSENSESFNAAWGNATKDTKYKKSAITIANTDWELPTVQEDVYYKDANGNYTDAEGNIVDAENKVLKETITRPMQVEIKGRGNSTWALDKKPFQIKFEKAVKPFDMGSEKNKTWILLANHADRTMMRNQLAFDWARKALSPNLPFVTDTKPVELYINGEYQGVYLLVEKSEVGSSGGRVNIQMAESNTNNIDDIGFLAEWDKLAANMNAEGNPAEDYVVRVSGGGWSELFTIKDGIPECATEGADGRPSDATTFENLGNQSTEVTNTNDTVNAIDEYLSDIAATIMSGNESDIKTKVDINSLVDMFILQELTKNPDAGGSSFYVYKDKGAGAKLIFSPPWDFDKALGDEVRVTSPYGLYIYGGDDQNNNQDNVNTWYKKLYEQDWFKTIVRNRWKELRNDPAKDPKTIILSFINEFPTTYSDEINRNRDKWYTDATNEYPDSQGGFWGDRGLSGYFADDGKTYDAQKNGLYNWVTDRIRFLDTEWDDSEWVLIDKFASDGFQLGQGNDHELNFNVNELFATYSRVKIVVDAKGYDLRMYLDPASGEGKLAIPHQTLGNPQTSGDQGFERISYELDPVLDADKVKAVLQASPDWSWVREFAIYGVEADITEDPLNPQPTFRVNNASYGSLNKQVSANVYYLLNERITAVAKEGYKFVNWTIVTEDGKNVVPITDVFPDVTETSSRLTITADMAGRIIYANFGKLQEIKFEAEDFVDFISEGYIVSKGQTGDITEDGKTYTAADLAAANGGNGQKISNDAFFGRDWTHDTLGYGADSMPYDKPKVVTDNEGTKIQNWDNKPYTAHQIVTEGYSGGKAVALTGPTSGIAIPFKIAEQLYEPFKFAVGYNYGDLPTYFRDFNQIDGWNKDSLYVNIYTTAQLTPEQTAALRANGWSLSEYAKPDAASDYLLNNAEANDGELQTAFYKQLPINAANTNGWTGRWMTNNGEEARENVQEVDLSIPAGMPVGQYYISVATDHNNLLRDSARMRLQENGGLVIKQGGNNASGYYDEGNKNDTAIYSEGNHTETPGTAYYDYIKFYTASTPDKPSQITVGANFIFKDMFGNSLMTSEYSDTSFDAGLITFTPKVPRYLKVQGYKIDRWEYTDPDGNPAILKVSDVNTDGSLGGSDDVNDDGTLNNNAAFELLAKELEKLKYKQGTTVTFTAHYTVPDRQYEVTLIDGTMFTSNESTGEFTDLVEPHEIYLVGNYQKIKLVANESKYGEFSHWLLNGQIYSYDSEIFFTAWTNARFEACYVEGTPERKVATFIDPENIQMYGFTDDTTTAYNKITFNCAFYIPDGVEYVGGGLLYTPDQAKLQDGTIETLVTINELGELNLPDDGRIAVSTLRYEQLNHELNNQVLMSITGTKKGRQRTARTYIIYKQIIDGAPKYTLAFSDNCVTVTAGDEKYMSTI